MFLLCSLYMISAIILMQVWAWIKTHRKASDRAFGKCPAIRERIAKIVISVIG
jgi:hypothetical protein